MHAFTPEAARARGGPAVDERIAAAERAAATPWPSATEEIWRYSRIGELSLDRFTLGEIDSTVTGDDRFVSQPGTPSGVVDGESPDLFADLNAAFGQAIVVTVPRGTVVTEPIIVTHRVPAAGTAVFPRLIIDAGEDSEVTVVERFTSVDAEVLVVPVVEVRAAQAARVKYLAVNELSDLAWQIGHQQAVGGGDSNVTLATVALGGHYARVRSEARITGRGGNTRQIALYFADGKQMHDFRTIQDHDAPYTTSDLLFKGAVQDVSASVYTGLIKIRPHARGTSAFQTNRNLTLGEGAWAESVPNLQIETNDVKCSHASTVGPIDPEQLLLHREPRRAHAGRLPPHRARVLRRGPRPAARAVLGRRAARSGLRQARHRGVAGRHQRGRGGVMAETTLKLSDLAEGTAHRVLVGDVPVVVVRIDDGVYAIGDICSHADVSLSGGEVYCQEREIECPQHGSVFSLVTGHPDTLPATQPVPVFDVVVDGDTVTISSGAVVAGHHLVREPGMTSTLAIRGLRVAAGGKEILRGIDLTVSSGEVHAVMGPNGAGKSTLSGAVMGKPGYEILDGTVTLDGIDVLSMPVWERAAAGLHLVMQYPTEVPGVALDDLMTEALVARGQPVDGVEALLEAEAERIGLAPQLLHRSLNVDLSGGEKKRNETLQLAVLRAADRDPRRARLRARRRCAAGLRPPRRGADPADRRARRTDARPRRARDHALQPVAHRAPSRLDPHPDQGADRGRGWPGTGRSARSRRLRSVQRRRRGRRRRGLERARRPLRHPGR